jgi:anaerobic magnesium-protoporphyrin IX monomethyl ester cyclase
MKNIKKIMLIYPPTTRPKEFSSQTVKVSAFFPLGLGYLAAVLEKQGKYEITIMDALAEGDIIKGTDLDGGERMRYGLTDKEIEKRILAEAPDVIGISCMFGPAEEDLANICHLAKNINPEIVTITGGHHVSNQPVEILEKFKDIDFVVEGEGEEVLLDLLSELEGNQNFASLDGVTYRIAQVIKSNKKTKSIKDLDSIPYPARHLFNMQRYFELANPHGFSGGALYYTQMVNTRGCPCKCTFCTLAAPDGLPVSQAQRRRSVKNILDEMEHLINEYGIQEFHFEDDNLTANKSWAEELFDGMIERDFNIAWHVPSGLAAYTLSERMLAKMKKSGCHAITIAIESGNQQVLNKLMRKPMQLKYIPKLVKAIRSQSIDVRAFFLLGFPGETKENMRETVNFAKNIELDWAYFSAVSPLPGTRIHDICVEKKYISLKEFDFLTSFNRSIINTEEFTAEWVNEFREEAMVDVCFRNNANLLKHDIDKAIDNFKSVVKSYPHFDFANFYLGEAYLKKGDKDSALLSYQNTLSINPDYQEAKQRIDAFVSS